MSNRMTDERLAEIEAEWSDPAYQHPDNITWDVRHILELTQALKAERQRVAELEAALRVGCTGAYEWVTETVNKALKESDEMP